jgi:hypothetical protein
MLGCDLDEEHRLYQMFGGSPGHFFQLAQRIAFGVTQPDLIRIDVVATARRMVERFPELFPAHLFHAWVWRGRDPEIAGRSLARARAFAPPEHPWRYLLPRDDEWRAERPRQQLIELVPDRVWRVPHLFSYAGSPLHGVSTASVVRLDDGAIAIINPVEMSVDVAREIEKLGRVRWICSQGKVHGRFVPIARRRFPGALALGTAGHLSHPGARGIDFDGLLGNMALPAELEVLSLRGHVLQEVELLHRPTGLLVTQDLIVHNRANDHTPFVNRLYGFAFGIIDRVGLPSFGAMMWQDLAPLQDDVRRILDSGFTRVTGAHWPAVTDGDAAATRASLQFMLATSGFGHKSHLARYFMSQPTFLRDFVKYELAVSSNRSGARLLP